MSVHVCIMSWLLYGTAVLTTSCRPLFYEFILKMPLYNLSIVLTLVSTAVVGSDLSGIVAIVYKFVRMCMYLVISHHIQNLHASPTAVGILSNSWSLQYSRSPQSSLLPLTAVFRVHVLRESLMLSIVIHWNLMWNFISSSANYPVSVWWILWKWRQLLTNCMCFGHALQWLLHLHGNSITDRIHSIEYLNWL